MTKTINGNLLLAKYYDISGVKHTLSIDDYKNLVNAGDKSALADFIYNRLHTRYLKPFIFSDPDYVKHFKNGFSIMANCCLLIETLESFKQGLGDSNRNSQKLFVDFLGTDPNFTDLKSFEAQFYFSIRCGILHQGETTNGWIISRSGKSLFDSLKLKVDAVVFLKSLDKSLNEYRQTLINSDFTDTVWVNFLKKMTILITNCAK
jgi:hypothetical protein